MTASTKDHLADVALHTAGGGALGAIAYGLGGSAASIVFCLTTAGLLRELAQANKSNIIAAVRDMPTWGWWGHLEWLAWGVGAALVGLLWL